MWRSDSEVVPEARLGRSKLREFRELFGYILGNRDGINVCRQLPGPLQRRHDGQEATCARAEGR